MDHTPAGRTAKAVRAEMARAKVGLRELAADCRIPKSTLARRLNGTSPFTVTELAAIADRLRVPLAALLPAADTRDAA